ncbi:MAG: hypothetical protein JO210_18805 [Acidobacteriaceae bacterium]|nr:hypothetical protein [Acidobacteriaceae bacterium]
MIKKIRIYMATALSILAFALASSTAKAQSRFTGNYPVSVTEVQAGIAGNIKGGDEKFCLALNDDGGFGRPNSGTATLEGFNGGSLSGGEFYVIGKMIYVNFVVGSTTGEAVGMVLFAPANPTNGTIGTGIFGLTGGEPSSGLATVGAKNGC